MSEEIKAKEFNRILEAVKRDEKIIGMILSGARGKGIFTENSDYDVVLVTADDSKEYARESYKGTQGMVEIGVFTISEFRDYAVVGSPEEWDRYAYAHIKAHVDKTGEIQKIIDEKGVVPDGKRMEIAKGALDGYLNSLYRSIKNQRDGNMEAFHLDAVESIPNFLRFIFSVEGRVRPYNKFLKWELERYPLKNLVMEKDDFFTKLEKVLATGNVETQKELYRIVAGIAQKSGCENVIRSWDGYYFG
ncbi:MAG: nucleotidyltransferase domain-containing protein [Patescibacteria group bacterium]|nr:nucleotidyltransferase domain-containing protein [Patescibacteria group bacterium]